MIQVSTGDLLRNEISFNTKLGKQIESIIKNGDFVSDNIVNEILENVIKNPLYQDKLVFDGYPRNLTQAKNLEILLKKYNQKISTSFFLNVEKKTIEQRIYGRIFCDKCKKTFNKFLNPPNKENHDCGDIFLKKRIDDNSETIIRRFDRYLEKTKPVLEHYKQNSNYHIIDGSKKIHEISSEIELILSNLNN